MLTLILHLDTLRVRPPPGPPHTPSTLRHEGHAASFIDADGCCRIIQYGRSQQTLMSASSLYQLLTSACRCSCQSSHCLHTTTNTTAARTVDYHLPLLRQPLIGVLLCYFLSLVLWVGLLLSDHSYIYFHPSIMRIHLFKLKRPTPFSPPGQESLKLPLLGEAS